MVRVVDAPTFDHEIKALIIFLQEVDGLCGHIAQGGFSGLVLWSVQFILHVGGLKEAEEAARVARCYLVEVSFVPDVFGIRAREYPFRCQVTTVFAIALARFVFWINLSVGQKLTAAATKCNLRSITKGCVDELGGNISADLTIGPAFT